MKVAEPILITGSILVSSSISEPDVDVASEVEWDAVTTFGAGDYAISTTTHRRFLSLQDGNTNHALPAYPAITANDWWQDDGPTNQAAMFDLTSNAASEGLSPLEVTFAPGKRVNALGIVGVTGDSVTVTGTSGGETVYGPNVVSIRTRDTQSWYDYFFGEFTAISGFALYDLPPYTDLEITVSIARAAGNPSCVYVVVGNATYIGDVETNAKLGADNYSQINRDEFGNAKLVKRRSIPTVTETVYADASLINKITGLIDRLNATPALWSTIDDADSLLSQPLLIVGIYKSWPITFLTDEIIQQDLELEQI